MAIGADLVAMSITRMYMQPKAAPTILAVEADAINLPFRDGSFTHVWCQSTLVTFQTARGF
jgi:ubiquinone/menaquinone biosynthesis C-methylase UbiE